MADEKRGDDVPPNRKNTRNRTIHGVNALVWHKDTGPQGKNGEAES